MQIPPMPPTPSQAATLRQKAQSLEAEFLAQMLRHAGLTDGAAAMGGGTGAEQFASFLREAQAGAMVRAGGIGLAEALFRAMGGGDERG
ncbi:MAG: hypothetical protein RIT14_1391 [Pseudomonadota bacterium]